MKFTFILENMHEEGVDMFVHNYYCTYCVFSLCFGNTNDLCPHLTRRNNYSCGRDINFCDIFI